MSDTKSDGYAKWLSAIEARYGTLEAYRLQAKIYGHTGGVLSTGGFRDRELARKAGIKGGSTPRIKSKEVGHEQD